MAKKQVSEKVKQPEQPKSEEEEGKLIKYQNILN